MQFGGMAWSQATVEKPAEALYLQLGSVGLDPANVYKVRGASLDRSSVHISLDDGQIGFTHDVMGRITGAFFEGEGEVLVQPPNAVERRSLSVFTGTAILEEHFETGYFRFNDNAPEDLRSGLRAPENPQEFVTRWDDTAKNMAKADAMRILMSLMRTSPASGPADHFLHVRLQGTKLGVFDVYFDSLAEEQVEAGQSRTVEGIAYYDVWTSFSPEVAGIKIGRATSLGAQAQKPATEKLLEDTVAVAIRRYVIDTEVRLPKLIHSKVRLDLEVRDGGTRVLLFELSRFLQVESVKLGGQAVEFIHNPAVEGTDLSRRGDDLLAVILPAPVAAGSEIELEFVYGGEVLADAGHGLMYVGEHGTWYPNRGIAMSDFDLTFHYPQGWTLVATGKPTPVAAAADRPNMQTTRWVSERPIPFAGFNLGKYKVARTQAGRVTVETYATEVVEKNFPTADAPVVESQPVDINHPRPPMQLPSTHQPSPAQHEATVGEAAARAIEYYAARFGPYPYNGLALTQMPGPQSQGWPGLVFLSSYAFLSREEREQLHFSPERILIQETIPAHETGHQWWGDLVTWRSYRDQWFSEGLANYCALMMLQEKNPAGFKQVMEKYRHDLVEKNADGVAPRDAGPVTLGARLLSSRFPEGYEAIAYGRATWLFHMLRTMLRDGAESERKDKDKRAGAEEPFVRALHKLRQRYEGKAVSTEEIMSVFAEDLPPALQYEGKQSLDWFLEGWINGIALPKLELKSVRFTPKGAGVAVSGTIVQKDAPEDLVTSVPVYGVVGGRQTLLGRVFADGEETVFHLSAPAGTSKVVLDPNQTVLTSPK